EGAEAGAWSDRGARSLPRALGRELRERGRDGRVRAGAGRAVIQVAEPDLLADLAEAGCERGGRRRLALPRGRRGVRERRGNEDEDGRGDAPHRASSAGFWQRRS